MISYVEDCDSLKSDLNCVYDWENTNNMVLTHKIVLYIFSTSDYVMLMLPKCLCY